MRVWSLLSVLMFLILSTVNCAETNFSSQNGSQNGQSGGETCAGELCFLGEYDPFDGVVPSNSNSGESKSISYIVPPATAKADILFFIDPSGSMTEEMTMIGERFAGFINSIGGLDWRVAISSTDMSPTGAVGQEGRLIEFISSAPMTFFLTPLSNNYALAFRNAISLPKSQTSGDDDERGIYNANLALDRRLEYGFFRPDANLHFVFVSDENERSSGSNLEDFDLPATLISRVGSILSPPRFTAHSIITRPNDTACLAQNGARYGTVYAELSQMTRGSIGDICSMDYTKQLLGISYNLVFEGRKFVQLPCVPAPNSVKLTLTPAVGISHSISGDKIVFRANLPPGIKVDVTLTCL